jgi:hypothetical protein
MEEQTLELEPPKAFKAIVLKRLALFLSNSSITRAPYILSRKDQLALYFKEPLTNKPLLLY